MCTQPIRLTLPFCSTSQEKQTNCSLILRTTAVGIGAIALLSGILILCGIPGLSTLGTIGGGMFSAVGAFILLVGTCLRCVKESKQPKHSRQMIHRPKVLAKPKTHSKKPRGDFSTKDPIDSVPIVQSHSKESSTYSLDAVIDRVHQAREDGTHTALFLGRTNDQVMPQKNGWAWFSLDIDMNTQVSSHYHLKIDFNNTEVMKKIYFLFDKVVVDWSVIKFFDYHSSPWDNLHPLLFKQKSSELIVEAARGGYTFGPSLLINARHATLQVPVEDRIKHFKEEQKNFNDWTTKVGPQHVEKEYSAFLQQLNKEVIAHQNNSYELKLSFMRFILKREGLQPKKYDYSPQLLEAISDYLSTLFHDVKLKNGPYPYRQDDHSVKYWVVRDPK